MDVVFTRRAYQFPALVIWSLLTSHFDTIWRAFTFAARNVPSVAPTLVCLGAGRFEEKAHAVSPCAYWPNNVCTSIVPASTAWDVLHVMLMVMLSMMLM